MGRRVATGLVVGLALLAGASCSDDGGDDPAGAGGSTTTDASTTTGSTSTAPTTTEAETTTTTLAELGTLDIRAFVEEEHPDEAALVDWTTFRWVGFNGGYTAHVPEGTDVGQGVAVCEAISEIVYQHSDFDPIAVVIGLDEVPLVRRDGPDGTCAPG